MVYRANLSLGAIGSKMSTLRAVALYPLASCLKITEKPHPQSQGEYFWRFFEVVESRRSEVAEAVLYSLPAGLEIYMLTKKNIGEHMEKLLQNEWVLKDPRLEIATASPAYEIYCTLEADLIFSQEPWMWEDDMYELRDGIILPPLTLAQKMREAAEHIESMTMPEIQPAAPVTS